MYVPGPHPHAAVGEGGGRLIRARGSTREEVLQSLADEGLLVGRVGTPAEVGALVAFL